MARTRLARTSQWLPTVVVLAVVLFVGGRLIALGISERAVHLRDQAQTAVSRTARSLERSLAIYPKAGVKPLSVTDRLLSSTALKRLAASGYNFEVSEVDPASRFRQVLARSQTAALDRPAMTQVRAPVGLLTDAPRGHLELAATPKNGWYPARDIATSIGLLAIVAWLLAFGAHDMSHALQRSKSMVGDLRERLRLLNQRLTSEIDSRQQLQQSFDHARYHDAFTGLPNRRFFMDRLDRSLRDVRARKRQRVAIVLIELDRFRLINDTLGRTAGDELMVQAARRFVQATSTLECVLARWGEEQFAALVLDVPSNEGAFAVANAMQTSLLEPFELRKHRLNVTAHMGVTAVESGLQRAEDALREADIALSVSKRSETQNTIAYLPSMGGDAASLVSLEADMHLALQRNEFRLLFQPIVDLRGRRTVGAEALLRWKHPMEGVLAPARFLTIAEEAGLLVPITKWVILRVCRLAGEWRRRLPKEVPFYFSINLSAAVLRDPGFVDYVSMVLRETEMPPSSIKFELTEGGLINNVGAAREVLERLHDMGIELMLDDFGTGYSSLSYLQLFPFDYLKIDRPFVDRTGSQQSNNAITSAVLQMASSLSLKTVAEVVETSAAAHALTEMGCDYGQGYYFSEPLPAEEALERIRKQGLRVPPAPQLDDTIVEAVDESPTLVMPADWITADDVAEAAPPPVKRAR